MSKAKSTAARKEAKAADRAARDAERGLLAIVNIGERMKSMPIEGWTMEQCLLRMARDVRRGAEAMPVPSDPKLAKRVKKLTKKGLGAIDAIEGASSVFRDSDYDDGVHRHPEAEAIGTGIERLAKKACKALDAAACLMDIHFMPMYGDRNKIRAEFGLPREFAEKNKPASAASEATAQA